MVCGICNESGHNQRTCPKKLAAEGTIKVPNKETKKVINTSNSSIRSYSTTSAEVQDIRKTISFANEIEDDFLDLKEILSKRQTSKQKERLSSDQRKPTKSVNNHDEKEAIIQRSNKEENNSSTSSTKLKSKKSGINWLNEEALQRLDSGPTKEDGPGYIYMYKISNPTTTESKECEWYKIGLSKDLPARRIHVQETANKQKYETLTTHETLFRYLTETVIHRQLKSQRTPRSYGDGRTEWFKGDKNEFKDIIVRVIREVKALYVD
ncbi:unnamed protein product [Orchesella dallaii]|uniref:Bacteriophage T5 Orf172 DNA-binding domain-containing protein n=1 Tax=Orchesella dallaii TaxID=48710 RepID=A0ABP1QM77_9HEXA